MKVVQIIDQLNPGGAERICITLTNLLHDEGVSVEIASILGRSEMDSQINNNIKHFYLNRDNKWNVIKIFKLGSYLKKFDIIHVHSLYNYRYVRLVTLLLCIRKKVILHDHSGYTISKGTFRFLDSYLLNRLDYYIGVNGKLVNWIARISNLPLEKIGELRNVISIKRNSSELPSLQNKKILMVGNFRREKNYEFAIELFKTLTDYELHIYGWRIDQKYYENIIKLIKNFQLNERIKIIDDCNNISGIIHNYSIGWHTSLTETGPLCLVEYLSAGLPFLSFDTGSVVDSVKELCPEMVIGSWNKTTWLTRLGIIENSYMQFQDHCISIYKNEYSEKEYVKQCLKIYNTVLDS